MGKRSTTLEEQISKMKQRGIIFSDEEKAKENLLDIGYFRLGYYCFPFEKTYPQKKNRTHEYKTGTLFDDIITLYYFDVDLRNLLCKVINRIEINFRTYLIYTVSNKYKNDPIWFVNRLIVDNVFVDSFDNKVYNQKFKEIKVIKCHHLNHTSDKYAPAWKTIEYMTFGAILKLYKNLKDINLKLDIAKYYGFRSAKIFENNIETIILIRNSCAHSNVLFDLRTPKSIIDGPAGKLGINKNKLFGAIEIIKYMIGKVSKHREQDLINGLDIILKESRSSSVNKIIKTCSGLLT